MEVGVTARRLGEGLVRTPTESFLSWSDSVDSFLEEVAQITDSFSPRPLAVLPPGSLVATRYRLVRKLGRGSYGVVWLARDELSSTEVAVKLVVAGASHHAARLRAEIASLRTIRAAGVVRLVEEGIEDGIVFMVMPFIDGVPFPACDAPARWSQIESCAARLLEALGEVHAAGIVHRDLKPANVLVRADGTPILLDFGLSLPAFCISTDGSVEPAGTPAYLAPEQVTERAAVGPRADLYAVGAMLYQSLTGRLPHDGADARALLTAKAIAPTPIRELQPAIPMHVASTIDALLAPDPRQRPESAAQVIRLLSDPTRAGGPEPATWPRPLDGDGVAALDRATIASLLVQHPDELPVRDAVAALLLSRTAGKPSLVREQLTELIACGVCRRVAASEDELLVSGSTLDLLEAQLRLDEHQAGTTTGACDAARAVAAQGSLGVATMMLLSTLTELRKGPSASASMLEGVLSLLVEISFCERSLHAMDRVLFEICRSGSVSMHVRRLEQLVRARLSVGPWTERALGLASQLEPFAQVELELLRQTTRVLAARRTSIAREEAVLDELSTWAGEKRDPAVEAVYAGWLGKLRYRQGRFLEAATLHRRAAVPPLWKVVRATSLMNAASAYMEGFDLEQAAALADQARSMLAECRSATGEAQAAWFVRTIAYRRGLSERAAERHVSRYVRLAMRDLEGLAYLTEAAIAWRTGDLELGRTLAERGRAVWAELGETAGAGLMAAALALACSPPDQVCPQDVAALGARAIACETSGVGLQVLALLAPLAPAGSWADHVPRLASQVPPDHWPCCIDIMSVDEALARTKRAARVSAR